MGVGVRCARNNFLEVRIGVSILHNHHVTCQAYLNITGSGMWGHGPDRAGSG